MWAELTPILGQLDEGAQGSHNMYTTSQQSSQSKPFSSLCPPPFTISLFTSHPLLHTGNQRPPSTRDQLRTPYQGSTHASNPRIQPSQCGACACRRRVGHPKLPSPLGTSQPLLPPRRFWSTPWFSQQHACGFRPRGAATLHNEAARKRERERRGRGHSLLLFVTLSRGVWCVAPTRYQCQ